MKKLFPYILCSFLLGCSIVKNQVDEGKVFSKNGHENLQDQSVDLAQSEMQDSMTIVESGPTKKFNPNYFLDKTKEYGLAGLNFAHAYAVDFDNDGHTDLVTLDSNFARPNFYKFNAEKKQFVDIGYLPFDENYHGSFLNFVDLNRDGILDLAMATLNQPSEVSKTSIKIFEGKIKNAMIHYKHVKNAFREELVGPTTSMIFFDYDLDGNLDLFIGNWFQKGEIRPVPQVDRLFRGDGLKFEDVTHLLDEEGHYDRARKIFPNARPTQGAASCDIDLDGFPDLLTATASGMGNRLWHHQGLPFLKEAATSSPTTGFKDVGLTSGFGSDAEGLLDPVGGGNTFYAICADYNDDGFMDVAMGELFHSYDPESRDRSSILSGMPSPNNSQAKVKFLRSEYIRDYGPTSWGQGDRRAVWWDFNNDSFLDLLVENSGFPPHSRLILFEQESNHAYSDVAQFAGIDVLNPAAAVILDVNQDGMMDLILGQTNIRNNQIKPRAYLFQNVGQRPDRKSVRFYLHGEKSNRQGIGAVVLFKTATKTQRRYVEYNYGHLPDQNEEGIHFGIGDEALEYVEIRWPYVESKGKVLSPPELKRYDLGKFIVGKSMDITLCESGRYMQGKHDCK